MFSVGHKVTTIFAGLIWQLSSVTSVAPDTLQMVNVLYRHGDRSPVATYPLDPYQDVWPQGLGWLTEIGMQQQYELGQYLRLEYGNILNTTYINTEIHVESSDVNRTLMSAYCNLAGLYPPKGDQIWNPSILWQPIPVHTRPGDMDPYLAMVEDCPVYDQLYAKELQNPAVQKIQNENLDFFAYLENYTGVIPANVSDIWMISDALYCAKSHNYTLPEWAEREWDNTTVYEKLRDLEEFGFNLLYSSTELSRLKGGPLLSWFIQNMMKAIEKSLPYKMYMYSGHDATVAAVSDAMSVFNFLFPPYAAALLVELHEVDADFCVKIRYRNDTTVPPYTLIHPDCQKECCPLNKFVAVTEARVPLNWMQECGYKTVSVVPYQIAIGLLVALVIILLIIFFIAGMAFTNKKAEYSPL